MTVEDYMKKGYSREEAISIIEWDKETDKMTMKELNAEMTEEEKANTKLVTNSLGTGKIKEKKEKKKVTRKPNLEKQEIVNLIYNLINENYDNVNILNKERLIAFTKNGVKYEVVVQKKNS